MGNVLIMQKIHQINRVPTFKLSENPAPSYLPLNRSPGNLHVSVGVIKVDVIISRRGGGLIRVGDLGYGRGVG